MRREVVGRKRGRVIGFVLNIESVSPLVACGTGKAVREGGNFDFHSLLKV